VESTMWPCEHFNDHGPPYLFPWQLPPFSFSLFPFLFWLLYIFRITACFPSASLLSLRNIMLPFVDVFILYYTH
jgi:hypothetical protein